MGRPKILKKRKGLSISINIELDKIVNKYCEENNINKSKYIEFLIKKDIIKKNEN